MPEPFLGWWNCDMPLSPGDIMSNARIRALSYDLEVSLEFFISNINRFVPHGLNLTQLSKPVPNGLWPPSLPEEKVQKILLQNGMLTQFELPHKCELAQFSCSDLDHLLRVVEIPEIKSLLLK
jgi:hypothetical protein